jgi:hypothetical protein
MNPEAEEFWRESFELEAKFGCELRSGTVPRNRLSVGMIKEHDCVVLTRDLTGEGLKAGDIGTVVHIHGARAGFEVEFITLDGETVRVVTLSPDQVRPIAPREIAHARALKSI